MHGRAGRDPARPRDPASLLLQCGEAGGVELGDADHDAAGGPDLEVGGVENAGRGLEVHAAGFHRADGGAHRPQFGCSEVLNPGRGDGIAAVHASEW